MKNYEQNQVVKRCYPSCKFFKTSIDGMECNHPYWNDKEAYSNMIITQSNSKNGDIPEKCPLRGEPTKITITYKLDENVNV